MSSAIFSSDTQAATTPVQASSGVSVSTTQDSTGVTTAPGTTVVSTSAQTSQATSSTSSSFVTSSSTTAASSSSVTSQNSASSTSQQSFSSTQVVTVPPSTSTDPSSTSVIFTPSSSSTSESSTESTFVPVTTSSSTSVALSTGAGGTIYSTTVFYTYISSTRTRASSTSRVTGLTGSSGSTSGGGGTNTGAIVGGVVGGVGGLALLALAGFFLMKKKKKARAAALDEKMAAQYDPGYGRNNSNYLLGDLVNGTGVSPIESSHISPFPRGPDPGYAGAAVAAGLGAGAAGAYAHHNRGYGSNAGGDGYDNMTTTGGGSSYDDHASYTHGMQPMNPYATYPTNAAYPSPALNRTDYAADLPNESMRNPRWSGGWGVAAMAGAGSEGQQAPYSPHEYAATQPYGMGAPVHTQTPSDPYYNAPTGAAGKRQEAEAGRAAYTPYNNEGPSGGPSSAPAGRTSIGNSAVEYGQGPGSASVHARGASDATDAMGRRESGMDANPSDEYPGSSVMVHTDGGEVPRAEELPPTYNSIRPEDREQ
ncbi:hypothetical protein QFC22_002789 [Naganishia vaughanmartiniae]|uniref:Uncharacterized protein n=1 Tax=Naganishia vaughanmartiniae TaxID=1424756 RepID=A0ACC2XBT7_9TREE|nr:hypothetical protein QFC22_002789 [Naganishia vaughanmartiniae]